MSADALPDCELAHVTVDEFTGFALVLKGHDLDDETLTALAAKEDFTPHVAVEVFWHETRRVMWCDRIDGFGCDSIGEWHRHWSEVTPTTTPGCQYTVLYRDESAEDDA